MSHVTLRKLAFSTVAVFLLFIPAYIALLFRLGSTYELHVTSTIIFTALSVLFVLGMFNWKSEKFESNGKLAIIFGVLVFMVLFEELLLNSTLAMYGLALSIAGLVCLPVLAVFLSGSNTWLRVAIDAVALIFATRVVLSPFPVGFVGMSIFLPTIYTLILVTIILYSVYRGISARDLRLPAGKRRISLQLCMGAATGVAIGLIEYFILRPSPLLSGASLVQMIAYIVIAPVIMVGIVEELLFRGLLQGSLEKITSRWQAIGISSIIFGLMHIGWMNPLEVLFAYGAAVVFGYIATVTDSLIAPITAHALGNFVLYMATLQAM